MTEAIKTLSFANLIFVISLMLSGTVGGVFGELIYYFAFIIPIALGFYASTELKAKREEVAGVSESPDRFLSFDIKKGASTLPLIFPSIALIFTVSLLTSLLLSVIGVTTPPVENGGLGFMFLAHALVPALFEEMLFRYIPMKLLLPYSKRCCILFSAFCFALIHCSFVQMPYAFIAGVIFMLIDVAFGSVWPSIILHLVNNSASVIWIKYCSDKTAAWIFIAALIILTLVSMAIIYKKRTEYCTVFRDAFDKAERFEVSYAPVILIMICSYAAALNLTN